MTVHTSIN